ncbi:unnamed protein product [Spirodela intermedia]|uniref:Uncharacterized protein n=2 Tax=Spirodela intermedia TaxID=51605 RepID=A0A7I8J0Q0_SPIIN|nr:unnamed protein product [Spirodela intermedia]CAA6663796.1 unnamed protein product [Spirodela intermedia]CAA7400294.1 unnamed protein product [Spirodela intermedia]
MPSEASLVEFDVKTSSLSFRRTMSPTSGQSPPALGIRAIGSRNLVNPAAAKTPVRPRGVFT